MTWDDVMKAPITTNGTGLSAPVTYESILEAVRKCPPAPPRVRVVESPMAVVRPWVFPKERFFEWEPADERFCRKFGIGHEGPSRPGVLRITDPTTGDVVFYVHPSLMKAVRQEMTGRPFPDILFPRELVRGATS